MEITLNGVKSTSTVMTVLELIRSLEIDPKRVAVELNLNILPKSDYDSTQIHDGDTIEIVHFVGGG
jgi:sulfur carrier protein